MNRRRFIRSVAIGGCGTAFVGSRGLAGADTDGMPTTKRFVEQRWALDNIIRANGIDWDQPRSIYLSSPCGVEASADFAAIRTSVQKLADIGPAFENIAKRRESKARAAENDGYAITARDNWYMAAIHYGAAEWPYDDAGKKHIGLHQKKRECFVNYARLADHKIEAVSIPFKDNSIPAWFHLPPGYSVGKVPVVIAIPGMDSFKETSVALANDRWMMRGVAVLAIDGPGQYESPLLGVYVSMQNWIDAGPVLVDWLSRRVEIDTDKIGVTGTSFGSFFGTILTANEPRIAATAVISTCLEPGCHTIFEEASPTFKKRFMWMSNYGDEVKFDEFVKTLTWEGHAERIRSAYLVVAGEADELSPLEHTERMIRAMTGPRQLVVYADSRHSVGNVPAANLGPFPPTLVADWLVSRLNGKPFKSERWFVEPTGRIDYGRRRAISRESGQAANYRVFELSNERKSRLSPPERPTAISRHLSGESQRSRDGLGRGRLHAVRPLGRRPRRSGNAPARIPGKVRGCRRSRHSQFHISPQHRIPMSLPGDPRNGVPTAVFPTSQRSPARFGRTRPCV